MIKNNLVLVLVFITNIIGICSCNIENHKSGMKSENASKQTEFNQTGSKPIQEFNKKLFCLKKIEDECAVPTKPNREQLFKAGILLEGGGGKNMLFVNEPLCLDIARDILTLAKNGKEIIRIADFGAAHGLMFYTLLSSII